MCKKEWNPKENLWKVWLREIRTGLGENVVLWVDDEILPREDDEYEREKLMGMLEKDQEEAI